MDKSAKRNNSKIFAWFLFLNIVGVFARNELELSVQSRILICPVFVLAFSLMLKYVKMDYRVGYQ